MISLEQPPLFGSAAVTQNKYELIIFQELQDTMCQIQSELTFLLPGEQLCFVMLMRSVEEIMMRGNLCFINISRAQRTHHLKTCLWVVGHEKENQDVCLCYAFMVTLMGKGQQY